MWWYHMQFNIVSTWLHVNPHINTNRSLVEINHSKGTGGITDVFHHPDLFVQRFWNVCKKGSTRACLPQGLCVPSKIYLRKWWRDLLGVRDIFSRGLMPNVTNTNRTVPNAHTVHYECKYSGIKKKCILRCSFLLSRMLVFCCIIAFFVSFVFACAWCVSVFSEVLLY